MQKMVKDPDDVLDYGFNWAAWLGDDEIVTSAWLIADPDPDGLAVDKDSHTQTATTVWLSAGTFGVTYVVTNRVTTLGGRTADQSMKIQIKEQ